ncbi:MAG: WalW protein, partial [Maioricimonas sp. JB049]
MKPVLIVTVDTEEEGLWGGRYRATENTVENIQSVPLFQEVCDRYGIRPTYLVDTPVIEDDRAAGVLQEIHESGRAEIGAHLHPWCSPPLDGRAIEPQRTFMCNLSEAEQREKLRWLTDAIEQRFGRRPTSFRA